MSIRDLGLTDLRSIEFELPTLLMLRRTGPTSPIVASRFALSEEASSDKSDLRTVSRWGSLYAAADIGPLSNVPSGPALTIATATFLSSLKVKHRPLMLTRMG